MEKCKICDNSFKQVGVHLLKFHKMSTEDYVILTEYDNVRPKCKCGYCNDDARFHSRTKKFVKINKEHTNFNWIKDQRLKTESPKCITCGGDVNWNRGKPNKYCSFKCLPNNWNQDKIKKTVKDKYGVDVVSQNTEIKEKLRSSLAPLRKNMAIKCNDTKRLKYENGAFDPDNLKRTMMKNHGVEHPSQIQKNRDNSSIRMKINNPYFDENGDPKHCRSLKYNDELYYQSSYEKHFLDLCADVNIIDKIENGHSYSYIEEDKSFGHRVLTDFTIGDTEIEIKSKWILEKQGGVSVIEAKRRAIESTGKKYMLILDKDYTEFLIDVINKMIK